MLPGRGLLLGIQEAGSQGAASFVPRQQVHWPRTSAPGWTWDESEVLSATTEKFTKEETKMITNSSIFFDENFTQLRWAFHGALESLIQPEVGERNYKQPAPSTLPLKNSKHNTNLQTLAQIRGKAKQ